MPTDHDNEDHDVLPVPLDRETLAWLAALSRVTGTPPAQIVASMLHDIRVDDGLTVEPLH